MLGFATSWNSLQLNIYCLLFIYVIIIGVSCGIRICCGSEISGLILFLQGHFNVGLVFWIKYRQVYNVSHCFIGCKLSAFVFLGIKLKQAQAHKMTWNLTWQLTRVYNIEQRLNEGIILVETYFAWAMYFLVHI